LATRVLVGAEQSPKGRMRRRIRLMLVASSVQRAACAGRRLCAAQWPCCGRHARIRPTGLLACHWIATATGWP